MSHYYDDNGDVHNGKSHERGSGVTTFGTNCSMDRFTHLEGGKHYHEGHDFTTHSDFIACENHRDD